MPNFGYDPGDEDGCTCAGPICTCGAFGKLSTNDVAHPDFERHEAQRIREMEGRRPWLPDPPRRIRNRSDDDLIPTAVRRSEESRVNRVVAGVIYRLVCPYCGGRPELVGGDEVYPHRPDLAEKRFWLCRPCDAYVGCHSGTDRPLGTPAKAPLRRLRSRVHAALDPLWRSGRYCRGEVYDLLAAELCIPPEDCHVGMFGEDRCRAALAAVDFLAGGGTPRRGRAPARHLLRDVAHGGLVPISRGARRPRERVGLRTGKRKG